MGAVALIGCYLAVLIPFRDEVLSKVFRPEFTQFTSLILPTAIAQFVWAASIGFVILLKADQRVRATFACMAAYTIVAFTLTPLLASGYGVLGVAGGLAPGTAWKVRSRRSVSVCFPATSPCASGVNRKSWST